MTIWDLVWADAYLALVLFLLCVLRFTADRWLWKLALIGVPSNSDLRCATNVYDGAGKFRLYVAVAFGTLTFILTTGWVVPV